MRKPGRGTIVVFAVTCLIAAVIIGLTAWVIVLSSSDVRPYPGVVVEVIPPVGSCHLWILPCESGPTITVWVNGTNVTVNDDVCGIDYRVGDNITLTWNQNWTSGPYWSDNSCFL